MLIQARILPLPAEAEVQPISTTVSLHPHLFAMNVHRSPIQLTKHCLSLPCCYNEGIENLKGGEGV